MLPNQQKNIRRDVLVSIAKLYSLSACAVQNRNKSAIDDEHGIILHHLIEFRANNPGTLPASIETFFTPKTLDRIGEHKQSISTLVIDASNMHKPTTISPRAFELATYIMT